LGLESDWSSLSFFFALRAKKLLQSLCPEAVAKEYSIPFEYQISNIAYRISNIILPIIARNFTTVFKHNFHTHTNYCDGSSSPEEYVIAAIKGGLSSLGFSGHAPVPFENNFAIKDISSLTAYADEIRELKKKYSGEISIFLGLEADFIPGITMEFKNFRRDFGLDYIIGSVHLVKNDKNDFWFIDGSDHSIWEDGLKKFFDSDITKAVSQYYHQINMMIETQKPDVIGHLDKIKMHNRDTYFSESSSWYTGLVKETLDIIKQNDLIVEVNTRGIYKKRSDSYFPGLNILKGMLEMNIPLTISADAHKPEEVSLGIDHASKALLEIGYREVFIYTEKGWKGVPIN